MAINADLRFKMAHPIFSFDKLRPVTMTIIASYDIQEPNLPALFMFLPVTDKILPPHLAVQKKQGKIRLPPELNKPGEILSMRYEKQIRGITRSEKPKSFSHSIIVDIGTSERIISVKFSKTLEFTGPTSIAVAREAAENLLAHTKRCQEDLVFIRNNRQRAHELREQFVIDQTITGIDAVDEELLQIFRKQARGYPEERLDSFLTFMIEFNRDLYEGSLKLGKFECEMANILFNLSYSIDLVSFAEVMNRPPFRTIFNNYKSASAVVVYYDYMKIDRTTGQQKQVKHSIRVNQSGHVRHSGPNLKEMRKVYNAFMQKVILNYDAIRSIENKKRILVIEGPSRPISIEDWRAMIKRERALRSATMNDELPMAIGETLEEKVVTIREQAKIPSPMTVRTESRLDFDYSPLCN